MPQIEKPPLQGEAWRPIVEHLRQPALALIGVEESPFSRLGGQPTVPEGFEWPTYAGKSMSFLAQIDLAEAESELLPESGYLYFFYDQDCEVWGDSPRQYGGWKVIYVNGNASLFRLATTPDDLEESSVYKEKPVRLEATLVFPTASSPVMRGMGLSADAARSYHRFVDSTVGDEAHWLLGEPALIQMANLRKLCQILPFAMRIFKPTYAERESWPRMRWGSSDWRLLLQLDSDRETEFGWGDAGRLYFWIHESDLKQRRFDRVWMFLQCY